jgi:hypothetical protein
MESCSDSLLLKVVMNSLNAESAEEKMKRDGIEPVLYILE